MSSSSKRQCAFAALLVLVAIGLSAQNAELPASPAPSAAASIFSFELGAVGGYGVGANAATCGRTFGFDLAITDKLAAGYANTLVTSTDYSLVHLGYGVTPVIGVDLYAGSNTASAVAIGLGASYAIFQSKSAAGIANALKARLEYLFDVSNGIGKGDIVAAVVASVGL